MAGAFMKGTTIGPRLSRRRGHRPVKRQERVVMFLVGRSLRASVRGASYEARGHRLTMR
jgi:hypothetical protein